MCSSPSRIKLDFPLSHVEYKFSAYTSSKGLFTNEPTHLRLTKPWGNMYDKTPSNQNLVKLVSCFHLLHKIVHIHNNVTWTDSIPWNIS